MINYIIGSGLGIISGYFFIKGCQILWNKNIDNKQKKLIELINDLIFSKDYKENSKKQIMVKEMTELLNNYKEDLADIFKEKY
tara:strand:+ start:6189 stop:6437 length:249 start_codon:yes stop_codon:yes gene_type:complete